MNIKNQVTSLELSKKLKKLGVKQESLFWWKIGKSTNTANLIYKYEPQNHGEKEMCDHKYFDYFSAFTVNEIFPLLNREITIPKNINNIADFVASMLIDKLSA